jgi:hypothetical protein
MDTTHGYVAEMSGDDLEHLAEIREDHDFTSIG